MKSKFMFLFMLMLFVPMVAFADMGGPMLRPYEMVVVADAGIDYYTYNGADLKVAGHFNKGDKFTVEFELGNGYSIYVGSGDSSKSYTLVTLDGTLPVQSVVTPSDVINDDNSAAVVKEAPSKNAALVYADEGVDVFSGPSTGYNKVGHLNKGNIFKYSYVMDDHTGITHVYINNGNVTGWVNILYKKVLLENQYKFIAYMDVTTKCGVIPKNTVISPSYVSDVWSGVVLYEKDDCSELLTYRFGDTGLVKMYSAHYTSEAAIDIYEYANNTGEKLGTIPAGSTFEQLANASNASSYEATGQLYVTYENITGWIKTNYSNYHLVDNEFMDVMNDNPPVEVDEPASRDKTDTTESEKPAMTPLETTLMYVVIGLAVALTALVIIIFVNKNKKVKNVDNKEE